MQNTTDNQQAWGAARLRYLDRTRWVLGRAVEALRGPGGPAAVPEAVTRAVVEGTPRTGSNRAYQMRSLGADVVSLCRHHGIGYDASFAEWWADATTIEAELVLAGALSEVGS